ncbi:MAG TPA: DUF1330 domain-containing protein [Nocardioides sp.]|uniref:Uncharacterized protein (DUF1330 family) n=1 Tax=Nocardioides daedukensis TaxID=634462 RepID=A0A7Y9S6R4_9ACTN|nr:DUF1330 domain-containing protein [Nocardioides daedukensis]NYG60774.1 uncharacterized protein (DUF1330 family) [Nocardioides daedukensis]
MTAYWISTYNEILDADKMAAYAALAGPALTEAGGTFLARDLAALTYEDASEGRVVIIRFDSVEQAQAAHDSAAYQAALDALAGGVRREIRIVPGVA